jgi:hypothetical protein
LRENAGFTQPGRGALHFVNRDHASGFETGGPDNFRFAEALGPGAADFGQKESLIIVGGCGAYAAKDGTEDKKKKQSAHNSGAVIVFDFF